MVTDGTKNLMVETGFWLPYTIYLKKRDNEVKLNEQVGAELY